ncbi:MAG: response regulator transcription factor [Bacillota bacterium]|nr:response regulator transcription factor [Bacillota bacterium]
MERILLIEDDQALGNGLVYALSREGFAVEQTKTLAEARAVLKTADPLPDLIILDILLPDGYGYDLCKELRSGQMRDRCSLLPIIYLSACDSEVNITMGLDGGGDDYLTKPFRIRELISRIRAVLRRGNTTGCEPDMDAGCLQVGGLILDPLRYKVWLHSREINLTSLEFRLLMFLMRHEGRVLARSQILAALWDDREGYIDDNTLSVHIRHLREKIEQDPARPNRILTVRGVGYRLDDPNA